MSASLTIDTKSWVAAVTALTAVSSRALPEIINNSAGSVAIKAYRWTKVANRKLMKEDFKNTTYALNKSAFKKDGTLKKGYGTAGTVNPVGFKVKSTKHKSVFKAVNKFKPWVYAKVRRKYGKLSSEDLATHSASFYAKRHSAVAYVATGWRHAIVHFGKQFKSVFGFMQTHNYGDAMSSADTQYPSFTAMLANYADTAPKNAGPALQIAIDQEATELRFEVQKRVARMAEKKS